MNSVEKTVDSIKLLIASGDLSDSLHLRQLHKSCLQAFKELNSNLEECRTLVENGSIQAARQLNCSFDPSLTQIAEYLEFFKDNDFFSVCKEYGLEEPVFPDEQLLMLLNTPVSSGEKHLHALLQDYRKIARNGTMQQRITLLRKIVKKLPDSSRWRNDLISAERSRTVEMEKELKELEGEKDPCEKLEELYREVMAPEWLVRPKEELVDKIRGLLLPLQQKRLEKEVESKLQILQDCWMERDIYRLEKEYEQWQIFCTNPMIRLTAEQQQTIVDIQTFFKTNAEEKEKEDIAKSLILKIEHQLIEGGNFSTVAVDYHQLQLMDYPIPPALAERLKSLEAEQEHYDRLRNIRWCIGGVAGAILLIVLVLFSVRYTQHYLAVKRNSSNMQVLLQEKRYDEIIKLYNDLHASTPKIAEAPQILLLHTTALNEKEKVAQFKKRQEDKLIRLIKQIETLSKEDVLDNSAALDRALAEAAKTIKASPLKQALLDRFSALETALVRRRTDLKQKRETEFLRFCRTQTGRINTLILQIPQKQPGELDVSLGMLTKEFTERMARYPFVPKHLKDQEKKSFEAAVKRYHTVWKKEKAFRSISMPASFDSYLRSLDAVRYEHPDLAMEFRQAYQRTKEWQTEYDNYKKFIPDTLEQVQDIKSYSSGLFRSDLEKIMPKQSRSAAFARFFSGIQKQRDLKELVFTAPDGKQYFFYSSGPVRLERLRRPVRTNISFTATAVGKEKNRRFILSFNEKNKKTPFLLRSKHGDLPYKLPSAFALLDGESKLASKIGTPWPGSELAVRCSALGSDGPGLNLNLQQALKYICKDAAIRNLYLKEILILHFLQALCETSNLYPELSAILQSLQEFHASRQRNWRAPQMFKEYTEECSQLEQLWNRLDLDRLLAAGTLRGNFICAAHARLLVPAGILRVSEKGKVSIHLFEGQKTPREGLVLEKNTLRLLPAEVWKGHIPRQANWKSMLFTGQIVWSFADGRNSKEFLLEWQKKALQLNIRLQVKPSVLPAELI